MQGGHHQFKVVCGHYQFILGAKQGGRARFVFVEQIVGQIAF